MLRHLFTILSLFSLLAGIGLADLGVRSNRQMAGLSERDSLNITRTELLYWLVSNPGHVTLCRQVRRDWDNPLPKFHMLGIDFGGGQGPGSMLWNLQLPYWLL